MDSPFIDVSVVPTYGKMQAQILWRMRPGFASGVFAVYRSPDGLNDWRQIGTVENGDSFMDADVITDGKLQLLYYQLILTKQGKKYNSSVINTLGTLSRQEFGAAYFIMRQEYLKLSQCTRVLVCKMCTTAPVCRQCVDKDTGQQVGTTLCTACFGTGFEGGYWPPATSFMQIISQSPLVQQDTQAGVGSADPVHFKVRMLAFPQLIKEDLIIDPAADRRYLVEDQDIAMMKGKAPLVTTVNLVLLRHSDVRYKFVA